MSMLGRKRGTLHRIRPVEDRRILAISMVLVAFICFTGIDTSAKWLLNHNLPTQEVVFSRYAVHLALVLAIMVPLQGKAMFVTRRPGLEFARGMMLLFSTALNFLAVKFLPLTVTGAIFFLLPLILCALSVPLLGEHVGWRRWVAVIIGFAGILIIIQPGADSFHWAVFLSLGATTSFAFYNILNRKLAGVDSTSTQQFYATFIATIIVAPFAFGAWVWPSDGLSWVAFFAMGAFGGLGHLLLTIAHRLAGASTLAPFVYTQIISMATASWLVFGQPPDIWIFLGAPIVIGSGLFIWLREWQAAKAI